MAKGSFYKYYVSKELFLYEVIKKNERVFFNKMIQAAPKIRQNKNSAIEVMRGLFTNKDFLFTSLLPEDIEILLRKTPPSYRKQEEEKSKNNFITFCQAMSIAPNEEFFGELSYLMLALQAIITSPGNLGETGQKKAILIMMQAIYDLIIEETENNGKNEKFNKKLLFDHLWITFIIMGVCWGMCVICGINGITKESDSWIMYPIFWVAFLRR